jgi:hypothetical protein
MPRHNHARGNIGYGWAGKNGYAGADNSGSTSGQPPFNGENQPHSHSLSDVEVESNFEASPASPNFTGNPMPIVPPFAALHYIIMF